MTCRTRLASAWVNRDTLTLWKGKLNAVTRIIMTIYGAAKCLYFSHQHSWLKRSSNQLCVREMIRGKTQTVGGPITFLMIFCLAPNSWSLTCSQHFLSVIITTFLKYIWRVNMNSIMRFPSEDMRLEKNGTRINCNAVNRCYTNPTHNKSNLFQTNWRWSWCSLPFYRQSSSLVLIL